MKTVAIIINEKSTRRHIDYAISKILTNNHRVLLIYIQKNRMVTFSDPYLLFQSAIIYNQVKENEKDNSRIHLGKIEKDIKKRIDIEVCKLVVMGNEHYKLECVLKTLDADCVVLEKERKFFGKKLGDRITDWGIVVVNVPNVN